MTNYLEVSKLIDQELAEAVEKHGLFVDGNHAVGTILEELDEATDEISGIWMCFENFKRAVRDEDEKELFDAADKGYNYTVDAIRELIQVAAMFQKTRLCDK